MNLINKPHYLYKNNMYPSRREVLEDMLINGDYEGTFRFMFNDDIFSSFSWKTPLDDVSIEKLYFERAKQIREEYDYLILAFSGGSDSNQILSTFLNNNIFIDEILNINYEKMSEKIEDYSNQPDDMKQILEYKLAVVPRLNDVKRLSPKTKITLIDSTDHIINELVYKKTYKPVTLLNSKEYVHYKAFNVRPVMFSYYIDHHMKKTEFKKSKTCLIRGFEKPIITIDDNLIVKCFFSDIMMAGTNYAKSVDFQIENFYWSEKAPLIPIKQSQIIKSHMEKDKNFFIRFYNAKKAIRNNDDSVSHISAHLIEREFSRYIYPDWNPELFAATKTIISPGEILALKSLQMPSFISDVMKDIRKTEEHRYNKIVNKKLLAQTLYTRPYILGNLNPSWRKHD
jgi:hypothetical protein